MSLNRFCYRSKGYQRMPNRGGDHLKFVRPASPLLSAFLVSMACLTTQSAPLCCLPSLKFLRWNVDFMNLLRFLSLFFWLLCIGFALYQQTWRCQNIFSRWNRLHILSAKLWSLPSPDHLFSIWQPFFYLLLGGQIHNSLKNKTETSMSMRLWDFRRTSVLRKTHRRLPQKLYVK